MKKSKVFKWLLILVSMGIVLFVGLHFFGGMGRGNMAVWQNRGSQMQAFGRGGAGGIGRHMMEQGRGFHHGGMMMNGPRGVRHFAGGHGFAFGGILFALGSILLGWIFRKSAGESSWRKWTGWLLIGLGAFVLFAKVLPLVVLAVVVFVVYKLVAKSNKGQTAAENWDSNMSFEPIATTSSSTGKMLDEWEQTIAKEDK